MIGSLLYLSRRPRLDTLTAVLILAGFQETSTSFFFKAVERIFIYLNGTRNHGLRYTDEEAVLICLVDSDYAGY